ncbi:hypothetical protein EDB19DRAFT_354712 [Suillus lakei]|nr:hypothetical protein EDB19DRAFT_354712 [Suillus lakei]
MCITRSLGIFRPEKGRVAGMIQWDQCPRAPSHNKYFCPSLNSSSIVMVSTGMKPAPTGSAPRMQHHGNESAADGDQCPVPRPTPGEYRKLVSGPQENIIRAMDVTQPTFEYFKKILRDQAVMVLDCERFLHEQIPDIWVIYLDWAREELASFLSKYTDTWPVELYIEHYLSKKTYAKRHAFRTKMTRLKTGPKTVGVKSSPSEQ